MGCCFLHYELLICTKMVSKGDRVIVLSPGNSKDWCLQICAISPTFSIRKLDMHCIHCELLTICVEVEVHQVKWSITKICREQEHLSVKNILSAKNNWPYKRGDHS